MRVLRGDERSETGAFAPVERPRLVERLAATANSAITLLIAPAGYGKSVVLSQYLRRLRGPHVRFALRGEHSTLLGFLRGFAEAMNESAPHAITALAGAFERTTASPKPGAGLAHWMHAHLESFTGVIAIDDLHLADDPEVFKFLAALIERTKARIRWILASRSTAGLPLGTWLGYRDAELPIDEGELRFTLDEVRAAARGFGLTTRDEELSDLWALTEGWPAAMSFALRTSTRSTELRNVSALTREMIYRFLAEQVYSGLDGDERALLEVAITLPAIDVAVLESAGFDRALPIVEQLRERTAFIYEESAGVYQCHDLFREFLRHQSALGGKRAQQSVQARAARALEANGYIEHAIASYVSAAAPADVVRLLEQNGFDMLERARGDVVARALDSLDEATRRDNATVLALQGALQAIAGKFARAESLLRRALSRAGENRNLVAIASLRLGTLLANQGGDVTSLLGAVGEDLEQSGARRAEALSLIAGKKAVTGDLEAARSALEQVEPLLLEIDSDVVRAKVLHYMGIAFHHIGAADRAFQVLTLSRDLSAELHLYSTESRASAVLSNLVLHELDDVEQQLKCAQSAADAAEKGGDAFALQTALLQMLSAEMRKGNIEKSIAIEQRLATTRIDELATRYLTLFRSVRLAWEGRFAEAHRLAASCWEHMPFDFDRIVSGSEYVLFLAVDAQQELSVKLTREIRDQLRACDVSGLFRVRSLAVARALCALAEAINGRVTHADRELNRVVADGDPVIAQTVKTIADIVARLRNLGEGGANRVMEGAKALAELGYADLARLLGAVDRVLSHGRAAIIQGADLTPSEVDVLRLLAAGFVPKDIATRTGRSVHTVRVHIANVISKVGCHGRAEAIRWAHQQGLI